MDSSTLPVELVSFAAYESVPGVFLEWTTASELDNEGFEVQKSEDGVNISTIGFVSGNGTTSEEKHYEYLDHEVSY